MKASILITTYNRSDHLYFCLKSIAAQDLSGIDYEIVVLNDGSAGDETRNVVATSDAAKSLNIRYLHTGVRRDRQWRTMGFAANIGIKQSDGEIVVLSNSDIYHVGRTVVPVIQACERDSTVLSSVHQVYDDDGSLIWHLNAHPDEKVQLARIIQHIRTGPRQPGMYPANPDIPFFLAVRRKHLEQLGGYDEDFIGVASEDCDLLDRLKAIGCKYTYAPEGAEAIHLFHNRRTIAQLEVDPGFAYNVRLRRDRRKELVRNQGKVWGELIDDHADGVDAPVHLVLWVTSRCNLDCPRCNQQATRKALPGYDMPEEELERIITSSKERGLHFSTIELTGGEPSLWPLFERGIEKLKAAEIADHITFITNGNDAARVARIANQHGLRYTVSLTQATEEQSAVHRAQGVGVMWNDVSHRLLPVQPVPDSLPAECSQVHDGNGRVVRQLEYIQGKVYYCCMAYANSAIVGDDSRTQCSFEENFCAAFAGRKFDLPICTVCLANAKVWHAPCSVCGRKM